MEDLVDLALHAVEFHFRCMRETPRWFSALLLTSFAVFLLAAGVSCLLAGGAWSVVLAWTARGTLLLFVSTAIVGVLYLAVYSDG